MADGKRIVCVGHTIPGSKVECWFRTQEIAGSNTPFQKYSIDSVDSLKLIWKKLECIVIPLAINMFFTFCSDTGRHC